MTWPRVPGSPMTAPPSSACPWPPSFMASSTTPTSSLNLAWQNPPPKPSSLPCSMHIKADGTYTPLDMGTVDQWEAATMGFQNIGPNYWQGEEGRLGLIAGTAKYTDPQYVAVWEQLAQWGDLPAQRLSKPKPIPTPKTSLPWAEAPSIRPVPGTLPCSMTRPISRWALSRRPRRRQPITCYISDHTDIALGMNPSHRASRRSQKRSWSWMTTPEFADAIQQRRCPVSSPCPTTASPLDDPIGPGVPRSGVRTANPPSVNSYQILSRGEPNLENELWALALRS